MQYSICELHKIGFIKSCTCGNDLREMLPYFRVFSSDLDKIRQN